MMKCAACDRTIRLGKSWKSDGLYNFCCAECAETPNQETKQVDAVEQDYVNSPSHYTQGKFEVIEVIEQVTSGYKDGFVSYNVGNVLKYISRAPYKHDDGGITDLKKAAKYLEFAINHLEGGSN